MQDKAFVLPEAHQTRPHAYWRTSCRRETRRRPMPSKSMITAGIDGSDTAGAWPLAVDPVVVAWVRRGVAVTVLAVVVGTSYLVA